MKLKIEAQYAHFSGKQFTVYWAIAVPGQPKYVYHLSGDTNHDLRFVQKLLTHITFKWGIENETVIIKGDNTPTQYKNKNAFHSKQKLSDKYNIRISRLYRTAGHGNVLIDAMSSFSLKSVIRKDVIAFEKWFENSEDI